MKRELTEREQLCLDILDQSGQPERVISHCKGVAHTAEVLAQRLNEKGCSLDVSLCFRSGLLHDICRTEKHHAHKGKSLLRTKGLLPEAEIVGTHMGENLDASRLSEAAVVCLADKLTAGGARVRISERFEPALTRFADDPEVFPLVKARYETALKLETLALQVLGTDLQNLSFD